ncbi:MAG: YjbQ family protein [Bacteroidales bacterium]|nr:YjbQ family protein [Bacteroidales bacterium]
MVQQKEIIIPEHPRGYHLITPYIEKSLENLPPCGLLHVFIKHTSAGITLNENADASVRADFSFFFDNLVPENQRFYTHTLEGADDLPAHLKSSIIGQSVVVPITNSRLNLGTWQGIYFCEFRNHGGPRHIVLTVLS